MSECPDTFARRDVTAGGKTKAELLTLLRNAGVALNPLAMQLLEGHRFVTSPAPSVLRVMETSVADLGLPRGATFDVILARAAVRRLFPGPLELAPHLRLQYLDQLEGSTGQPPTRHQALPGSVTIASIPLSQDEDFPCGFYLRKIEGVFWLRGYKSWPGHVWSPGDRFVFVEQGGVV